MVEGYDEPVAPPGREVVVTASLAGLILMLRLEVADCGEGFVESVTLMVTEAVPTEFWLGVPVIVPVALLIDNPLGRLVALKLYGVEPPDAATGLLYAAPTVPAAREAVVMVKVFVCVSACWGLAARTASGKKCCGPDDQTQSQFLHGLARPDAKPAICNK